MPRWSRSCSRFGGWQQTNFVAEEMLAPERNLPRALVIGVLIVVAAYLLVNVAYLRSLGISGLAGSSAPRRRRWGRSRATPDGA